MSKTSMNIRMDSEVKRQAQELFSQFGLDMTTAVNIFLRQSIRQRGIPFALQLDPFYSEANQARLLRTAERMELNDGYGSYVCEYGHIHNYKNFDFEAVEREIANPDTKIYKNVDEMWSDLNLEGEDA